MNRTTWCMAAAVAACLVAAPAAHGLINPNFTPVVLTQQSDVILHLTVSAGDKPLTMVGKVVEVLKGGDQAPKGPVKFDLHTVQVEQAKDVDARVNANPNMEALLFVGAFEEEGGMGGMGEQPEAYLHLGGRWLSLFKSKDGGFEMDAIDTHMEGTWAGSTPMLKECVKYIQADPNADVPVTTDAEWADQTKVAKLDGKVFLTVPVDLGGKFNQYLFVGCDKGDRLYAWDAADKALKDVTAQHKLASTSAVAAWGDFNRDGKLDLASYDGKALSLQLQQADGTFKPLAVDAGAALADGCIGLAIVDSGQKGAPALLASTKSWPVLVTVDAASGKAQAKPLGEGELPRKDLGAAAACLVADLDGDQEPDVLQLFAGGGLVYKGKSPGVFDKAAPAAIAHGKGAGAPFLGDYDADGLLDIFVPSNDFCRLWHNRGGFKFDDMLGISGEIAYISKPGAVAGDTGDVNNDGRQDILILYEAMSPQIFFNRGFRSTGHSHELDLSERELLPAADEGQQAGCLADLNGDGAQDMALALKNGELWVFYRAPDMSGQSLACRVALASTGPYVGPLTVTGFAEKRSLGAWNVVAGQSTGFLAQRVPGPVKLKWQLPGGKVQETEVILDNKPVEYVVKP